MAMWLCPFLGRQVTNCRPPIVGRWPIANCQLRRLRRLPTAGLPLLYVSAMPQNDVVAIIITTTATTTATTSAAHQIYHEHKPENSRVSNLSWVIVVGVSGSPPLEDHPSFPLFRSLITLMNCLRLSTRIEKPKRRVERERERRKGVHKYSGSSLGNFKLPLGLHYIHLALNLSVLVGLDCAWQESHAYFCCHWQKVRERGMQQAAGRRTRSAESAQEREQVPLHMH